MSTLTEAQEIEIVDEIIRASVYAIYPDALVTLKLARRCAELEGRDPKQAMRICARALLKRTSMNCMKLRVMLQSTAGLFPDGGVTQIQAKTDRVRQKLLIELRAQTS